MLIYHPAFDVNHCMLRFGRILSSIPDKDLPWDKLRILDFYYLFPHLLDGFPLSSGRGLKNYFLKKANRYNDVPSPRLFLRQIEGLQEIAIRSLSSKGFVEAQLLEHGTVKKTEKVFPSELLIENDIEPLDGAKLMELLTIIAALPLTGSNGLKAKSGLLEYRYDPD